MQDGMTRYSIAVSQGPSDVRLSALDYSPSATSRALVDWKRILFFGKRASQSRETRAANS
jgi:hypothetical protein